MALSPHVRRGQPLRIPHTDYNAFLDAAEAYRRLGRTLRGAERPDVYQSTVVLVRNLDGNVRDQYEVMGMEEPSVAIAANPQGVLSHPVFDVALPTSLSEGKFCVLQEPIHPGRIGRAVISGCTWAKLVKTTAYDEFCDIAAGSPFLWDSPAGSAQIIYDQGVLAAEQFAFVRLWGKIYARKLLAKAPAGGIAAMSGTTPASATVDIWRKNGSTIEDTGRNLLVFNSLGAVAANAHIHIGQDAWGVWWVDAEKCAE